MTDFLFVINELNFDNINLIVILTRIESNNLNKKKVYFSQFNL